MDGLGERHGCSSLIDPAILQFLICACPWLGSDCDEMAGVREALPGGLGRGEVDTLFCFPVLLDMRQPTTIAF
jgi:hypothetical protein